jgi:hypothetical protein
MKFLTIPAISTGLLTAFSGDNIWTLRVVCRRACYLGLSDFRHGALPFAIGRKPVNKPV